MAAGRCSKAPTCAMATKCSLANYSADPPDFGVPRTVKAPPGAPLACPLRVVP
jgi:hypothetical protein